MSGEGQRRKPIYSCNGHAVRFASPGPVGDRSLIRERPVPNDLRGPHDSRCRTAAAPRIEAYSSSRPRCVDVRVFSAPTGRPKEARATPPGKVQVPILQEPCKGGPTISPKSSGLWEECGRPFRAQK